ncbi:hypothetical protein BH23BAC1_BH23BAC1_10450 [soil metagenome]
MGLFNSVLAITILITSTMAVAQNGVLSGNKLRILVSTDIGGKDEDDDQSMVHLLMYSDLFDIEGIISSPPYDGRAKNILKVIDVYEHDYPKLKKISSTYPSVQHLKNIVKQGATEPAPPEGYSNSTPGSDWLIQCAKKDDSRPLYVLVWGSITDVAQALHDAPEIKEKIRVHFIASWNEIQDPNSFQYIYKHHPDLWMIYDNTTFRGWYSGGNQQGDLGNKTFIEANIKGSGALGNYFYPLKESSIKMGDTPTVARLLYGNPEDPTQESWGGRFKPVPGRPQWWEDIADPALNEGNYPGAKTVNKWREAYLKDWRKRWNQLKD